MQDDNYMDVDEITTHLGIDLLGIILDDDKVISTSNNGESIVMNPDNPTAQGYRNVARRLEGETVPLMKIDVKKESAWDKFKHLFKRN